MGGILAADGPQMPHRPGVKAEEIRQDLEKLKRWLRKAEERDWMGAPGRATATAKVAECEQLLEAFEADVYDRVGGAEHG
jgi:hypothetical protein